MGRACFRGSLLAHRGCQQPHDSMHRGIGRHVCPVSAFRSKACDSLPCGWMDLRPTHRPAPQSLRVGVPCRRCAPALCQVRTPRARGTSGKSFVAAVLWGPIAWRGGLAPSRGHFRRLQSRPAPAGCRRNHGDMGGDGDAARRSGDSQRRGFSARTDGCGSDAGPTRS